MKTKQLILYFVLTLWLLQNNTIFAQWSTNPALNNAICTATNHQWYLTSISDGFGGSIMTWQDKRSGNGDIYAQRIDACGVIQWTTDGVVICAAAGQQYQPRIVSDGSGGAIITWFDALSGAFDIYAQRINASGVVQWTANGVAISVLAGSSQGGPEIISDSNGGAIITWWDQRNGTYDIYAQRINASGAVQWTVNGIAICTAANTQTNPIIDSDGIGGAIITWQDSRVGPAFKVYAQRINASGVVQWTANGVAICTAVNDQRPMDIISDGIGGAVIAWQSNNGIEWDIYAQRINASGTVQWTSQGVPICTAIADQQLPCISSDISGGYIISWVDNRSGNTDIFAQKINSSGSLQWTSQGVAICTDVNAQARPVICSTQIGGAIISWDDNRITSSPSIYAQFINSSGIVQWTNDGIVISTLPGCQSPTINTDSADGAIIAWQSNNGIEWDIYAQRINSNGDLTGSPKTPGSISGTTSICAGSMNVYNVTAVTEATSYTWTLPGGWSGTSTTNSITTTAGVTGGNITVTANSSCGSSAASSLAITVNPLPIAAGPITGTASVCQGQNSVTYTLPSITNATTYIWTLPSGATGTSSINIITVNYSISAVSGNITVKGNNACGDGATSTLAITVNPSPTVTVNSPSICIGDVATINASGAATYTWSAGTITSSISVSPTITTNYSVVGTNSLGCSSSKTATVTVNVAPTLNISSTNTLICVGETATITANSSASTYSWSNGSSSSSIIVTPSVTTIYTITVSNGLCNSNSSYTQSVSVCTSLNELKNNSIKIYPNPASAELTISSPIKFTDVKIVNSIGQIVQESKYNNPVSVVELSSGIYFVQLFNENGKLLKVAKFIKE
jgi:hypothetical protein